MFDIAPSEFLLVAFAALIFIGPKDLPKALRLAGYWVGKARGVARQFRQGFDNMVREAELEEMEKKWRAENERIMREHPVEPLPAAASPAAAGTGDDGEPAPAMTERPAIAEASAVEETEVGPPPHAEHGTPAAPEAAVAPHPIDATPR